MGGHGKMNFGVRWTMMALTNAFFATEKLRAKKLSLTVWVTSTSSCWSCWWTAGNGVHTPAQHFIMNMGHGSWRRGSILKCGRSSLLWRDCFWFLPKLVKIASRFHHGRGVRLRTASRPFCPSMPTMPFNFLVITWGKSHRTRLGRQIGFGEWPMLWLPSVVNGNLPKLLSYPSSSWWNGIRPCLLRKGVCFRDIYFDPDWSIGPKCPGNDCYLQLDYEFFAENLLQRMPGLDIESFRDRLRLFLTSLYFTTRTSMSSRSSYVSCTQPWRGSSFGAQKA